MFCGCKENGKKIAHALNNPLLYKVKENIIKQPWIVSQLRRTHQTARAIARALGKELGQDMLGEENKLLQTPLLNEKRSWFAKLLNIDKDNEPKNKKNDIPYVKSINALWTYIAKHNIVSYHT